MTSALPGDLAWPRHLSNPGPDHCFCVCGVEPTLRVLNLALAIPDTKQLRDLLFERHSREEIRDARVNGSTRLPVEWWRTLRVKKCHRPSDRRDQDECDESHRPFHCRSSSPATG